jgi:pseudouridine-5'-phosphate glycosidase
MNDLASLLDIRQPVADALRDGRPVVALESTLIAHGLPWPANLETAREAEGAVRSANAIPATIAVLDGRPTIGLNDAEIERLARSDRVRKASRRDLAAAIALGQTAATTVSASMALAHHAGIRVFATGGIGGVHRHQHFDVSADLVELARTPVAVVCAGAKSILDILQTLEMLETLAVPVVGFGCTHFPGFYLRSTGESLGTSVGDALSAARLCRAHWALGGAGVVLAQPVAAEFALETADFHAALLEAEQQATSQNIRGPALTPFLLAKLAELTGGRTLRANQALVIANARLAAEVVVAYSMSDQK